MGAGLGRETGVPRNGVAFRSLGPGLILGGMLATLAAMFLPYLSFGGESFTWWQWLSGFDVALAIACAVAASLAVVALTLRSRRLGGLAGIGAAVAFGLAFAPVPGAIDDSHGVRAGLWIVAATGGVALAGTFFTLLTDRGPTGTPSATPGRNPRWLAVALVGALPVVALAVTDPFGYDGIKPKVPPTVDYAKQILDAEDASAFAQTWARKRVRVGESPEAGCGTIPETWPPRFECDIGYRHAPPGYKVIRARSSELHVVAVRPKVLWYRQDGKPDTARDRGRRNKWRIVSVIPLGGETKLERKVRTSLGFETGGADIRRVMCRRLSGRNYSCTAKLTSRRCRDTRVRDVQTLTVDDIRFKPSRRC